MGNFDLNIEYLKGEDDDLYGILHLGRQGSRTQVVKILISDHVKFDSILRIEGLDETDVDLFLVISNQLVQRAHDAELEILLQRAIVLTAMELLDT